MGHCRSVARFRLLPHAPNGQLLLVHVLPHVPLAGSRLYRKSPPAYADGVYMLDEELPSARILSDLVFSGDDGLPHLRNCTTMLAFFSQSPSV